MRSAAMSVAVAAGAVVALAGPAPAAGDVSDDVFTVTAISASDVRGVVDVRFPDGRSQRLTPADLGLTPVDEMRFGAAVASADVNGDGITDLVIGVPGNIDRVAPSGVYLVLGSAQGFSRAGVHPLVTGPGLPQSFGSALAVEARTGGGADVWIGAPQATVGGHPDAGVVQRVRVGADASAAPGPLISQDSAGVPGAAEGDDQFGQVLAPASGGVIVGEPSEDVGNAVDAGAVTRLWTDPVTGVPTRAQLLTQDSPGVPGRAEDGDLFGAAVSRDGRLVGVPGESLGTVQRAGMVQVLDADPGTGVLHAGRTFTQASPGVPGKPDRGDAFGNAVATGVFACPGTTSAAIGVPGEGFEHKYAIGTVTVLPVGGATKACPAQVLYEGRGLPGTRKAYEGTGGTLSAVHGPASADDLVIGSPREGPGLTGRVFLKRFSVPAATPVAYGSLGGDEDYLGYGGYLGVDDGAR